MRELLRRYRYFLWAVVLLLSILLLYSYNLRQKSATTFFERAVLTLAAPFQTSLDHAVNAVNAAWQHYLWLVETKQRNIQLEKENRQLRSQLQQVAEVRLQNGRLRAVSYTHLRAHET